MHSLNTLSTYAKALGATLQTQAQHCHHACPEVVCRRAAPDYSLSALCIIAKSEPEQFSYTQPWCSMFLWLCYNCDPE